MKRVGVHALLQLLVARAGIAPFPVALPLSSAAGPTGLYSFSGPGFCQASPVTNGDGIAPASKLVLDRDGYLYGTTARGGGSNGAGSIFRVSISGTFSNVRANPAAVLPRALNRRGKSMHSTNLMAGDGFKPF
jgi:uncharacterized repeat protein (TIGR03803 family)